MLAEALRDNEQHWQIIVHTGGGSFKSQFKKADKSGARLALILGDEEVSQQKISIKDLRQAQEQIILPQDELSQYLATYLG